MADKQSPRLIAWLLIFLYFSFLYNYGAKVSALLYTDFPAYFYGARAVFVDKHSPYDEQMLTRAANTMEPPKLFEPPRRIYPYLYPPPSLLMFYPLVKAPVGHTDEQRVQFARAALLAANHLCLLFIIYVVLVPIAGFTLKEIFALILPAFLAIYLVYSNGTLSTINLGQVNLIVLALLCLAWWGLKRGWPAWAIALPLGIACVFKIYPVLFLGLLVIRRRFGAALATAGVLVAICAVAAMVLPRELWHEWATKVLPTGGYLKSPLGVFPPTLAGNVGVAGFMSRLFLPPRLGMEANLPPPGKALLHYESLGRLLTYGVVAAITLITLLAAFISARTKDLAPAERQRRLNLEFAGLLVLTFLVAPLAWEHHLAYVTPAVVIALLTVLRDRPELSNRWLAPAMLLIACILGWPMAFGKLPIPRVLAILVIGVKFYAVMALWLFLIWQMATGRRAAAAG